MKRRVLLITSVGLLGGCLQNGAENTQGSDGTDQEEDDNGTDQETESNGTVEEPDSNTTDQDNTVNGTDQDDPMNGSDHTTESTETEQTDTSNGTTQDNATNGSAQEETGNGTDQDDHNRESRTYEIEAETSSESPIQHEFEVTQPDIHSPDSPLTVTVSISNTTDETISYGNMRPVMGIYQTNDEFILVPTFEGSSAPELGGGGGARPSEEHEYSFDEEERMWFATETISYGAAGLVGELEPDETRSREIVLIRQPHKEFPETVPSEFEFSTSFGVDDEDSEGITDYQHTIAFSLIATQ